MFLSLTYQTEIVITQAVSDFEVCRFLCSYFFPPSLTFYICPNTFSMPEEHSAYLYTDICLERLPLPWSPSLYYRPPLTSPYTSKKEITGGITSREKKDMVHLVSLTKLNNRPTELWNPGKGTKQISQWHSYTPQKRLFLNIFEVLEYFHRKKSYARASCYSRFMANKGLTC